MQRDMEQSSTGQYLMRIYEALLERNGNLHWWPGDTPVEIAIGAILTQNTAWSNVEKALSNMKDAGIQFKSLNEITNLKKQELAEMIRPSGYYNQKADRLLDFAHYVTSRYGTLSDFLSSKDTTTLRNELLSIKGIGKETADSILLYAGNHIIFVVDAYTRRLAERVLKPNGIMVENSYDALQHLFQSSIEPDLELYRDFHAQIVIQGKDFCRKVPRCTTGIGCPLLKRGLCQSFSTHNPNSTQSGKG